jgi:hypothetical protein
MRKEEFNKCSLADKAMILAESGEICRQNLNGNKSLIFFKVHDFYVAIKFKDNGRQIDDATAFDDPFLIPCEDFISYNTLVPVHARR